MEWVEADSPHGQGGQEPRSRPTRCRYGRRRIRGSRGTPPGLFGRTRGQARVRARIRPTSPRPKVERRDRRRSGGKKKGGDRPESATSETSDDGGKRVRGDGGATGGESQRASPKVPQTSAKSSKQGRTRQGLKPPATPMLTSRPIPRSSRSS